MQTINNLVGESSIHGPDFFNPAKTQNLAIPIDDPAHEKATSKKASGLHIMKLAMGGIIFLALSIGVFQYQFNQIQGDHSFSLWNRLEWGWLFLLLLVLPIEAFAGGMRIWMICRVLQPGVTYWTCFKSELANIGTGMLTPSQSGGGLGQIYILCRGGATLGSAATISFITFTGTILALLSIGVYSLFFPCTGAMKVMIICVFLIFIMLTLSMLSIAIFPDIFREIILKASAASGSILNRCPVLLHRYSRAGKNKNNPYSHPGLSGRLIDLVNSYHENVHHYLKAGKANFIGVFLFSFAFLFSRSLLAFLCLRFLGVDQSSLGHIVGTQLSLLFLIYFAPTPGGSGLSEYLSLSIMSGIIPMAITPYYNLLWRATTLYLPAVAGLLCVSYAAVLQGRRTIARLGSEQSKGMIDTKNGNPSRPPLNLREGALSPPFKVRGARGVMKGDIL
jgi:glycosyltransferase 2 family protein